jgi:hypothetical protein
LLPVPADRLAERFSLQGDADRLLQIFKRLAEKKCG